MRRARPLATRRDSWPRLAPTDVRAALATALVALLAGFLRPAPASAAPPADTMPYRVVHGRPTFTPEGGVTCFLWSEGGRLHVRIVPDGSRHHLRGELRTSREGYFRDVTPSSEDLVVKQSKPSKLEFETRTGAKVESLDVTLAGDFNQVTLDLEIDDVSAPGAVRIGARAEVPRGLPVRLDVKGADSSWIQRFGF